MKARKKQIKPTNLSLPSIFILFIKAITTWGRLEIAFATQTGGSQPPLCDLFWKGETEYYFS